MKRLWVFRITGTILLVTLAAASWVYVSSEQYLRSFARPAEFSYAIPTDPLAIERGDHLVRTRGCRGCHGDDLAGELMWGVAVAPNLASYARTESPATFEAALRHAIGRDGRALYSMPSYNFMRLSDQDVADIFAYLRTVEVVNKTLPDNSLPWPIRLDIALGNDGAIPQYLQLVPPLRQADNPDPRIARGEYIAMTTCNECHGFGLRADSPWDDETAPDLVIIQAYNETAFRHLMSTGIAIGNRELEMMSPVARGRFAHFSDQEVTDLYTFLQDFSRRAMDE